MNMKTPVRQNLYLYLALIGVAIAGLHYGRALESAHGFLRVWTYGNILMLLAGIPFLFLQSKAGIPDFVSPEVNAKTRFLVPVSLGIFFGVLDVVVIKVLLHPEPYTTLPPFLQPFPYSLFLYTAGAVEIEVFYRLIPLTLILLVGKIGWQGKYAEPLFWVGALLTSLREPIEQWPDGSTGLVVYALLSGFLMNFLQAVFFKRAGFLASLILRLGHYAIWHILLGVYVEFIELAP